jgi:thymidylate kinase
MTGKLITLEGGEGVGKTTNMAFVESWLRQHNIDFIVTREPGGTEYGEQIREVLLSHHQDALDPVAELLLIFAARAQHLSQVIRPALAQGVTVLCDRFTDATYAYQGGGRGLGIERVAVLEDFVQGTLRPDLTLMLDVDPAIGMARASERGELDRFETEKMAFFQQVRTTYLEVAAINPDRYRLIDASQSLDAVQGELASALAQFWQDGND